MRIVLTGVTGFIGRRLARHLLERTDDHLCFVTRKEFEQADDPRVSVKLINDIDEQTDWKEIVINCDVVIHAAARVHIMHEEAVDPLTAYREVNVAGTLNLARQALKAGVKRFIYISSIKVNGESTRRGMPYTEDSIAKPECLYGVSKLEAEQGLFALANESGMEVVVIRPVLVYGPGVKGNFQYMIEWLIKGIPLPLGAVNNRRSFVHVDNLIDMITTCITHPNAANQVFLVSDGYDISTTRLLKKLRLLLDKRILLLPFPVWLLHIASRLVGKTQEAERLCGNLQVDITKAQTLLGWQPVVPIDDALKNTVQEYTLLSD